MISENNGRRGTALVTGASSGIGYELAKLFAEDGYDLVIVSRTEEDLRRCAADLTAEFGVQVTPIAKDLFEPGAAFELYDEVVSAGITVNVLVNDAGQGEFGKFVEQDIDRLLD